MTDQRTFSLAKFWIDDSAISPLNCQNDVSTVEHITLIKVDGILL